jgi:hypothetical protein
VLAVLADCPLDGLAEVVPQMPPVGDLHRIRRSPLTTVGIAACPVPADQLRARAGSEPGRERLR